MIRRRKRDKVAEFERMRDALSAMTASPDEEASPEVVPMQEVRPGGLVQLPSVVPMGRTKEPKPWV